MTPAFPDVPAAFDRDVERLATPMDHPAVTLVRPELAADVRALLALTDPVDRHCAGATRLVAPGDDYDGDFKEYVLAPFARPGKSRFSDGSYGVLYAGLALETAIRESVYWLTQRFMEGAMKAGDVAMKVRLSYRVCAEVADVRTVSGGVPSIYNSDDYSISRKCGARMRDRKRAGIWYDSVRHRGGECLGLFVPRFVGNVRIAAEWYEFEWDGKRFGKSKRVNVL